MFSVWTLSSLILSCSLAFPIFNNSSDSHMETFLNVTERNSTETILTMRIPKKVSRIMQRYMCPLSTCSLGRLGSLLQAGDETAGDSTLDPWGIGKR